MHQLVRDQPSVGYDTQRQKRFATLLSRVEEIAEDEIANTDDDAYQSTIRQNLRDVQSGILFSLFW